MIRGTRSGLTLAMTLSIAACKTTGPVAQVDRARGEVALYSSGDVRTASPDPESQSDVRSTARDLERHIKSHPNDAQVILDLAQIRVMQGNLDEGESLAKKVLRLDMKSKEARKTLAQIAMRRDNIDLAEIFLNAVGGDEAKDSSVLNMLALIELKRQNNARATALFKQALAINPSDIAVRMNLGVLYLKYRQISAAAVQFERVLKSAPNHQDAKLHMAIIATARGETGRAETMFNEILSEKKDNPLALYNFAVLQKKMGNYDDALDNLKTYLKTAQGRTNQTDEVFALIDSINRLKSSKGESVSDDEIQALAATMAERPAVAQNQAKNPKTAPNKPKQEEFKVPEEGPAAKSASGEEIEDLERELAH